MNKDEAFLDYESIKIPNALPQKRKSIGFILEANESVMKKIVGGRGDRQRN